MWDKPGIHIMKHKSILLILIQVQWQNGDLIQVVNNETPNPDGK